MTDPSRKNCPRARSEHEWRLSAWLDGELGEPDARELGAHVRACDACSALVASLRATGADLREALAMDPDPGFVVRFRERRDELSIAPWWTWRQLALRLAPLALGALVLAWLAVTSSSPSAGWDLGAIEVEALGNPTSFAPDSPTAREPVLSIALGSFPEDLP